MNKAYKYLLMLGHLFTDINQGALPAILPFLISDRNMSYASAAGLIFAANIVSSVIQPVFGYLGDKTFRPWLMCLGIAFAGTGMAMIGICQSYWAICASASVSGVGVALFHPEGAKIANYVAGEKKGTGISVFAVGGNLGFAIGPIVASGALFMWGLKGTLFFLLPAYIMAGVMLFFIPKLKKTVSDEGERRVVEATEEQTDDWVSFSKVSSLTFCRSILHFGLMTFIPLYWIGVFSLPEAAANSRLTIFTVTGVVATLIGGRLADKYGFRRLICTSFLAAAPLLFILLQTKSNIAATLLIIPMGFAVSCPFSTMIALGQSFMPNHIGLASGISLGLAVSIGGMSAPVIGWIGDRFGLPAAMYAIACVAVLAIFLSQWLPKEQKA